MPARPRHGLLPMRTAPFLVPLLVALIFLVLNEHISIIRVNSFRFDVSHRVQHVAQRRPSATPNSASGRSPNPLVLLTLAYDDMAGSVKANDTFEEAAQKCGKNIGNLVWLYASTHLILDRERTDVATSSTLHGRDPAVLITPSANILWNQTDLLKAEMTGAGMLASFKHLRPLNSATPRFIMGLGVKGYESVAESGKQHHGDLDEKFLRELMPSDYVLHANYVDTLRMIGQDAGAIGVRGAFTRAVLHNQGVKEAVALGCPSLFLNPEPDMGMVLQRKIDALGPDSKVIINMPQRWMPRLMTFLLRLTLSSDRYTIVWQSPTDYWFNHRGNWDLKIKIPPERIHWFRDYASWSAFVCKHDAIIGARIHGNMIGLSCPIPTLLVASDIRTFEMARSMRIAFILTNNTIFKGMGPSLDLKGPLGDRPLPTTRELFLAADFNGTAFDLNRYKQAARYKRILAGLGMHASTTINSLASLHNNAIT